MHIHMHPSMLTAQRYAPLGAPRTHDPVVTSAVISSGVTPGVGWAGLSKSPVGPTQALQPKTAHR